jgi:hypothetical protein
MEDREEQAGGATLLGDSVDARGALDLVKVQVEQELIQLL